MRCAELGFSAMGPAPEPRSPEALLNPYRVKQPGTRLKGNRRQAVRCYGADPGLCGRAHTRGARVVARGAHARGARGAVTGTRGAPRHGTRW